MCPLLAPSLTHLKRIPLVLTIVLWAAVVAGGMKVLLDYQVRPGVAAHAPEHWPAASAISTDPNQATLILIAHPRCPCTRATMSELARLMARERGKLQAFVVFVIPRGLTAGWEHDALVQEAKSIPGLHVLADRNGVEAGHFGTATSGQALLYDAGGHLRFAGGITPGRGHAGESAGSDALVSFVEHRTSPVSETPVYGCELASPTTAAAGKAVACPQ